MGTSEVNPFSTRYVRPGAMEFLFGDGESIEAIVGRLAEGGWWGQIIGPHGSGKSTLLAALVPRLEAVGRRVVFVTLHQGEHRLPALGAGWDWRTQLIVDGFEQLGWFWRRRVKARCRGARCGLLVTAHRDLGLPTIFETRPSEQVASAVVSKLLAVDQTRIDEADVRAAYAAAGGNVRETLFRLFDVYEDRSRRSEVGGRKSS